LAKKWGTDKGVGGIDLASHYYELFKNRRQDVRKVLEIGIGHEGCMGSGYRTGASLFMWEEFFPNADIYALDNMTEILINQGRIHSRWCDQGSEESLKQVMPFLGRDFDLIVDDGSHIPNTKLSRFACSHHCSVREEYTLSKTFG